VESEKTENQISRFYLTQLELILFLSQIKSDKGEWCTSDKKNFQFKVLHKVLLKLDTGAEKVTAWKNLARERWFFICNLTHLTPHIPSTVPLVLKVKVFMNWTRKGIQRSRNGESWEKAWVDGGEKDEFPEGFHKMKPTLLDGMSVSLWPSDQEAPPGKNHQG